MKIDDVVDIIREIYYRYYLIINNCRIKLNSKRYNYLLERFKKDSNIKISPKRDIKTFKKTESYKIYYYIDRQLSVILYIISDKYEVMHLKSYINSFIIHDLKEIRRNKIKNLKKRTIFK
jgi:hypothetical protein